MRRSTSFIRAVHHIGWWQKDNRVKAISSVIPSMCLSLKRGIAVADVLWEPIKAIGDQSWSHVRNLHWCQHCQRSKGTKVIFCPQQRKDSIAKCYYSHNIFQILPKNKVLVQMMKDHMKLKGGFREKKGAYDLITTMCNITDKRRTVQSYIDHVFSFSIILTPSDVTSPRFPDVRALTHPIELFTSFCQQPERKVWAATCCSNWFSLSQRVRQGFSI